MPGFLFWRPREPPKVNIRSWNVDDPALLFGGADQEVHMKSGIVAIAAVALIASAPVAYAQGASSKSPGHEMQEHGSKKGSPGASGYAPGQEMQEHGSKKGSPGASG